MGLEAPLHLRGGALVNQVAVERGRTTESRAGQAELLGLVGPAAAGAVLVLTGVIDGERRDPEALATWRHVVATVHEQHEQTQALVGLQLAADQAPGDVLRAVAERAPEASPRRSDPCSLHST